MPTDKQNAEFLYSMLKQLEVKHIDWKIIAEAHGINTAHAARMRWCRYRDYREEKKPVPRTTTTNNNNNKKKRRRNNAGDNDDGDTSDGDVDAAITKAISCTASGGSTARNAAENATAGVGDGDKDNAAAEEKRRGVKRKRPAPVARTGEEEDDEECPAKREQDEQQGNGHDADKATMPRRRKTSVKKEPLMMESEVGDDSDVPLIQMKRAKCGIEPKVEKKDEKGGLREEDGVKNEKGMSHSLHDIPILKKEE